MKQCSSCGRTFPYSGFHKDQKSADGYANKCKICRSEYRKAYHKEKPITGADWDRKHPDRARERINRFRHRKTNEDI